MPLPPLVVVAVVPAPDTVDVRAIRGGRGASPVRTSYRLTRLSPDWLSPVADVHSLVFLIKCRRVRGVSWSPDDACLGRIQI